MLTFITLINLTSCKLPDQELEYLKKKLLTKITPENIENIKQNFEASHTIKYDPAEIKKIIDVGGDVVKRGNFYIAGGNVN